MAQQTSIEWTRNADGTSGRTWNPIAGCSLVSSGCTNCYAMRMAARLEAMGQAKYAGTTRKVNGRAVWTGKINLDEQALTIPLRTKKPTTWFVNSMSDLFHEGVPFEFVDKVFAVMALTPHHTYQILTKRPERMAEYLSARVTDGRDVAAYERVLRHVDALRAQGHGFVKGAMIGVGWPLRNVWLGCSPVNQKTLEDYLPHLLRCQAAVRFLSCEPLLDAVDLDLGTGEMVDGESGFRRDGIHWVIVGGESGPGARPCNVEWVRSIVRQCRDAGVACFVKQLGAVPMEYPEIPLHRQGGGVMRDPKGGDMAEWPEDLRVREMPEAPHA